MKNTLKIFGIIILTLYNVFNYQMGLYSFVITSSGMILIALACFVLARTKVPQIIPSSVLMFSYCVLCIWLIHFHQILGLNFVFIYVYPMLAIMLLGLQYGVVLSAILIFLIALVMIVPGMSYYDYHIDGVYRILASYSLVFFVMVVIEITRNAKDKLIEKQSRELKNFNKNLQKIVQEKTQNVLDLQYAIVKTMAELVEFRDDITGGHIERTYKGTSILLAELEQDSFYYEELNDWNKDLLLQSCLLHDIGKISISDYILKKNTMLNKEEFEDMKKHVKFGEEIIEKIESLTKENDFLKYAKVFAANHHEKWDGTGYPRGLKGNEIPLLGRIMAITDVYDALTSVRPYKKAFSHEEAMQIIIDQRGKQFDPRLVDAFIRVAEQFRKDHVIFFV
jgi:HD-GYP domain-containing protein (c-di-GMP phosphodiesterase class II)